MSQGQYHGDCFFCLEPIAGWRAKGWDRVFQCSVCGPCLIRVGKEQEEIYNPESKSLYEHVRHGDWASSETSKTRIRAGAGSSV